MTSILDTCFVVIQIVSSRFLLEDPIERVDDIRLSEHRFVRDFSFARPGESTNQTV